MPLSAVAPVKFQSQMAQTPDWPNLSGRGGLKTCHQNQDRGPARIQIAGPQRL